MANKSKQLKQQQQQFQSNAKCQPSNQVPYMQQQPQYNVQQQPSANSSTPLICYGCKKPIKDRYMLNALNHIWHEDCLKCSCCDCRLGEVGSTLFIKTDLILCKRDYLRMFGSSGVCSACSNKINAYEMVMRTKGDQVFHVECFACQKCNHRFCVGDKFYLSGNQVLCEFDYVPPSGRPMGRGPKPVGMK
ncbi:LIM domain only protein 3 [Halotydeus destructor]|nr:LIM domain only protein 3 [Halotydeus destructor]